MMFSRDINLKYISLDDSAVLETQNITARMFSRVWNLKYNSYDAFSRVRNLEYNR